MTTSAGSVAYDVGGIVGPPGPQGEPGPQGVPGTVAPGTYQCGDGEALSGLVVHDDGTATPICIAIKPGNG